MSDLLLMRVRALLAFLVESIDRLIRRRPPSRQSNHVEYPVQSTPMPTSMPDQPNQLSPEAQALLAFLVGMLEHVTPGESRNYPTYRTCHFNLELKRDGRETYGASLTRQCLQELAEWLRGRNFPAITGLIINDNTGYPNDVFFVFYRIPNSPEHWAAEIAKAKAFDWQPYIDFRPTPPIEINVPSGKQAQALLVFLVGMLEHVTPGESRNYPTYRTCHFHLELKREGRETYGVSLTRQCLQELAEWLLDKNLPAVTGLIINDNTGYPNDIFFVFYGIPNSHEHWAAEIAKAKAFDWQPYIDRIER